MKGVECREKEKKQKSGRSAAAIEEAENEMSEDEALDEAQYHEYLNSLLIEFLKKNNDLLRKKLLEEFERGAPLTGKNGIRKKLASFDMEFFGRAYLPHYFVRKSPKFHERKTG